MRTLRAYGPASLGNLAAGFDVLGAALAPDDGALWGDVLTLREAAETSLERSGPFAHQLPESGDDLVWKAARAFERQLGQPLPPLAFHLHKGLPVGSGLGSSSATVVATLRALNGWLDGALDEASLLAAAGEAEASASGAIHLDNVAPALLGGLRLIAPTGQALALPFPEALRIVVLSPACTLTTREARSVLPASVPLAATIAHAQNLAALVHALHTGDLALLAQTLRDDLAEPHRARLVPGFRAVQAAALAQGALGCSLSGAGPAVFAVTPTDRAPALRDALIRAWEEAGQPVAARVCRVDAAGARLLQEDAPCA